MPVEALWHDEKKTTIRLIVLYPWTWEEAVQAVHKARLMREERKGRIHFILDCTGYQQLPPGAWRYYRWLVELVRDYHEHHGCYVIINANRFLRFRGDLAFRLFFPDAPPRHHVSSLKEAEQVLFQRCVTPDED